MPNIFDEGRLKDLTTQKAKLEKEYGEISDKLEQDYATDGWEKNPNKMVAYTRDNMRHGHLQRELKQVNEEMDRIEQLKPKPKNTESAEQDDAFKRFILGGTSALGKDEQERWVVDNGQAEVFQIRSQNGGDTGTAASRSDDGSGGALTDITTEGRVIDELDYFGGVTRMCQIFNTMNGNEIRIPTHSDASAKGRLLTEQNEQINNRRIPDFDYIKFGAEQMTTDVVPIVRELIQDSVIDILGYARREVSRQMSRGWDYEFTLGGTLPVEIDGKPAETKAPQVDGLFGVMKAAQKGITTAQTGKVSWEDIIKTVHSVARAYRTGMEGMNGLTAETGGRVGWLISDEFEALIKMLTDEQGRPLWQAMNLGIGSNGMSGMIAGYPYEVSGTLDAATTGKTPALFGNFSYYAVRRINALEFFSFFDSNTAKRNRIEIMGYSRCFGRTMFPGQPVQGTTANKTAYGGIPQISKLTIK